MIKHTHAKQAENRCSHCNSLLAKGTFEDGIIEIMCKCGMLNTIENKKDIRIEAIKEELQLELMKCGISMKRSSQLLDKFMRKIAC